MAQTQEHDLIFQIWKFSPAGTHAQNHDLTVQVAMFSPAKAHTKATSYGVVMVYLASIV